MLGTSAFGLELKLAVFASDFRKELEQDHHSKIFGRLVATLMKALWSDITCVGAGGNG